jgi:PAS domain S-box-containing protein
MSIMDWLFSPAGLTPHGFCLSWAPGLVSLHAISDGIIGLAYFSIPLAIAEFVRRRPDLKYSWVAYLFVAFILACGATHFMSILTLWAPVYGVEGLIKAVTAVLSIATAVLLWPLIPKVAALPSAVQLEALNHDLEARVAERVAELEDLNAQLTAAFREKTAAQNAQAHSDAHFRASFESAAVGQVHYDPVTGVILRANHAYAHMLGYEPEDLVGRLGSDFTYPDDKDPVSYASMLHGESGAYAREKRYLRKDGSPVWGRVSASLVRAPGTDAPLLAVAVVEDIDEGHKAQIALSQAKQDLEKVVEERTAALAQRDLLLREVYHRVKNNLQIVDSLLMMQARRLTDPQAKAALENLRARVYALGLVHHQLMGSKDLETFDIAPFLDELSRHLLEGAGEAQVSLSVRAAPLKVGLDFAIPLGLLVTELVTNSMKHAFSGGAGAIEVTLAEPEAGQVELRVADDGKGYDPAQVRAAGPSLGASIVDGLVQQLKGVMTISTQGGTRSVIRLPAPVQA